MTVADLIELLKKYPADLQVAYRCYSEQCLLDFDSILVQELSVARPDGWIQNKREDIPSQSYLVFPGN